MADIKESDFGKVTDIANGSHIRMLDKNGNSVLIDKDNFIEAIRGGLPDASNSESGLMSSNVFGSIYYKIFVVPAEGTYNTGVMNGGIIMVQNRSAEHDVALALMFADGRGSIIINSTLSVGFFGDNSKTISITKAGPDEPIVVKNNIGTEQLVVIRIIQNFF